VARCRQLQVVAIQSLDPATSTYYSQSPTYGVVAHVPSSEFEVLAGGAMAVV